MDMPKHELPAREIQNLLEIIGQLADVKRYSRDFIFKEESVLEHTGFVVMFCYFVGNRLRKRGHNVNMASLLCKAVVHDLEETITGDVPRKTKHASPEVSNGLKKYELQAIDRVGELTKVSCLQDWLTAKNETIEGTIVRIADMAAVVYKTMFEVSMLGNRSFMRVSEEISGEIEKLVVEFKDTPLSDTIEELRTVLVQARRGDITFGSFFRGL